MNDSINNSNNAGIFQRIAKEDFENALRKGFWRSVVGWFNKSSNHLLPFDEIRRVLPVQGQYEMGVRQIPLEKIIGSVGRYNDFDQSFLPRHRHTSSRWINIDIANRRDINLPPIEVYKVGEVYFVKDGNHRVSVARERGQAFIDANVIEIVVDIPIDRYTDIDEIILRQERVHFYKATHIKELRPLAEIELTLPGQYEKLLEHIDVHRWYMGEHFGREIAYEEAVSGWYDEVYYPLVQVIESQDLLKEFPGRTAADLYLWIIEHLYYLREEFKSEISLQEAAAHFTEEYSRNPIRRMYTMFRKFARMVTEGLEDAADLELGMTPEEMLRSLPPAASGEDESSAEEGEADDAPAGAKED
jgi:hypothetical protein